ncbi:MAG: hypothetical protein GXN93_00580 [Candidatus Diapherotrites archaeon]|nr:hypothetical protein [Candidatus Diapherotrites archaeon]
MRWLGAVLTALIIISSASAYVEIYAKGFSYKGNFGNLTYVHVKSLQAILDTWQAWGFTNISVGYSIDPHADGILVLGCTEMDKSDVEVLEKYIENGGRVALDLHCPGPLDALITKYGVVRNADEPYKSDAGITMHMSLPYVDVVGYPVTSEITIANSPMSTGYTGMTYVGPTFTITNDRMMPLFATPTDKAIAFFGPAGKGYIFGTGCLLCSNQMLMANILDWLDNGRVDFPKVSITRTVHPQSVVAGNPIYDEIKITVPKNAGIIDLSLDYLYNEKGYCKMNPAVSTKSQSGDTITIVSKFIPEQAMNCKLGPAVVSMTWDGPNGKYLRKAVLEPVPIVVAAPSIPLQKSNWPYYVGAAIILALAAVFTYPRMKARKLKRRAKALKEAMHDLRKQLMTQQITEDIYKQLLQKYLAEYNEIRAELKEMGQELTDEKGKQQQRR